MPRVMRLLHCLRLTAFGMSTIMFRRKTPIVGTVILCDRCNLSCAHCAVNNIKGSLASLSQVRDDMQTLWARGVRILFFCGGETALWSDGAFSLHNLVREAKAYGFYYVNVVTNGTICTDFPDADLVLLSLDGVGAAHDRIRGTGVYERVLANLARNTRDNVVAYVALNPSNLDEIRPLGDLTLQHPKLRCISFNLHTPYPGTEHLELSPEQRIKAANSIRSLIRKDYPVFNLEIGLERWLDGKWRRPCAQCVVVEEGRWSVCGRCVEVPGLCERCGYLFAVEFSLLFEGNLIAVKQALRTYLRYA